MTLRLVDNGIDDDLWEDDYTDTESYNCFEDYLNRHDTAQDSKMSNQEIIQKIIEAQLKMSYYLDEINMFKNYKKR